ncbi:hypothetical protein OPT61_g568 [Boeremia exigua]|uniref:Uncharacterized protein n=1 Tax=Boeremia exigua TaxID=749465 RepID=A0ACC2ITH5_9PLEO|nr:hypothetical protein OPT61_g568 [Boeremia exigua]
MASESDPLQMILAELASLRASNVALQQELVQQREDLAAFRQQIEERQTVVEQSVSRQKKRVAFETEDSPALENIQTSGSGSSLSQTTPLTIRTPSEPIALKSDRLPDPPAFSGKRKDLPAFIRKLQYKLEGNADRFPTERSRLLYAHSRLDRDVASLIDSLMDTAICNVDQFVAFLEATSLSLDLQRAMVGETLPNNLNTYANLIATYDNNMRFLPTYAPIPYRSRTAQTTSRNLDAMEIDSSYAPVGSKEREDCLRKGLCFKCGKHGHISRDCSVPLPSARAPPAVQGGAVAVAVVKRAREKTRPGVKSLPGTNPTPDLS